MYGGLIFYVHKTIDSSYHRPVLLTIYGFYLGMDQYLLIPFLGGWTSIYQLFWCSPGVQGFDTLPFQKLVLQTSMFVGSFPITFRFNPCCGWPKPTICIHMLCSLQYIPIYSGNIISHGPYPSPMLGIWYLISHNLHSSRHIPTITSCRQETLQPLLHSSSPVAAPGPPGPPGPAAEPTATNITQVERVAVDGRHVMCV